MPEYEEQSVPPPVSAPPAISAKASEYAGMVGGLFGAGTLMAFIIGRIWKWWTEQRSTDSAGGVVIAANVATESTIKRQEERIQQLEARINALENRIEQESNDRRRAQEENIRLRVRNGQLVQLLTANNITVPPDFTS